MKRLPLFLSISLLFCAFISPSDTRLQKITVYDGKVGFGQWYVCDKAKTTVFEKDKKVITYINKSNFECFGIYFDPMDLHRSTKLHFLAGLETNYKDEHCDLYISFIDAGKKTSDFRKLKVNLAKGELKEFSLPLDEIIIKELKMDFTKVSSVLFYVESKREDGFWGNVVLKDISIL
jgi:hypothetical protein